MPNYFAHTQFGDLVLERLPLPLRARLEQEKPAYRAGLFGPDPLFFHHLLRRSKVAALGHGLHNRPAREMMARLRAAISEDRPFSWGYGAGFLCHFALDSCFHPLINRLLTTARITHTGFEAELDRMLLDQRAAQGLGPLPLPTLEGLPDSFYQTVLTSAYPGVSRGEFQRSFRNFRRISDCYIRLVGSPLRKCLSRGDCGLYRDTMTRLFQESVEEAAAHVAAFFEGSSLDQWYDRDFCNAPTEPALLTATP